MPNPRNSRRSEPSRPEPKPAPEREPEPVQVEMAPAAKAPVVADGPAIPAGLDADLWAELLAEPTAPAKHPHFGRFRNANPRNLVGELGGIGQRDWFPQEVRSLPEPLFAAAFAADLEWMGWAAE